MGITLLLLVSATYMYLVFFFAHILFVVNLHSAKSQRRGGNNTYICFSHLICCIHSGANRYNLNN